MLCTKESGTVVIKASVVNNSDTTLLDVTVLHTHVSLVGRAGESCWWPPNVTVSPLVFQSSSHDNEWVVEPEVVCFETQLV